MATTGVPGNAAVRVRIQNGYVTSIIRQVAHRNLATAAACATMVAWNWDCGNETAAWPAIIDKRVLPLRPKIAVTEAIAERLLSG